MFLFNAILIVIGIISNVNGQSTCLGEINGNIKESRNILYRGEQEFTIALLGGIQEATPNENIFFSPYSVYNALLLAYFGANNLSEKELIDVLRLQWAENKEQVRAAYIWEKKFSSMRKLPVKFTSANRIFFEQTLKITSCLSDILIDELTSLDFKTNAEQSRININAWIANVTDNEIPEMLNAGDVTMETDLLLANAAYFKGAWANQFDAENTRQEVFYTSKSKTSFVPMMHKRGTYDLTIDDNLGAHILQMPYLNNNDESSSKDRGISMIIILPPFVENGVENVLAKLKPDTLEKALKESMTREIDISLPKFEFEQRLELVPVSVKVSS